MNWIMNSGLWNMHLNFEFGSEAVNLGPKAGRGKEGKLMCVLCDDIRDWMDFKY